MDPRRRETALVLEGAATIEIEGGPTLEGQGGDLFSIRGRQHDVAPDQAFRILGAGINRLLRRRFMQAPLLVQSGYLMAKSRATQLLHSRESGREVGLTSGTLLIS